MENENVIYKIEISATNIENAGNLLKEVGEFFNKVEYRIEYTSEFGKFYSERIVPPIPEL